jgi:hypothetical protein
MTVKNCQLFFTRNCQLGFDIIEQNSNANQEQKKDVFCCLQLHLCGSRCLDISSNLSMLFWVCFSFCFWCAFVNYFGSLSVLMCVVKPFVSLPVLMCFIKLFVSLSVFDVCYFKYVSLSVLYVCCRPVLFLCVLSSLSFLCLFLMFALIKSFVFRPTGSWYELVSANQSSLSSIRLFSRNTVKPFYQPFYGNPYLIHMVSTNTKFKYSVL